MLEEMVSTPGEVTANAAATPAQRVLSMLQLMLTSEHLAPFHGAYTALVLDFARAAPSAYPILTRINDALIDRSAERALEAARELVAYEASLMTYVPRHANFPREATIGLTTNKVAV